MGSAEGVGVTDEHVYLSTACLHGHHDYCKRERGLAGGKTPAKCKFCDAKCVCDCHQDNNKETVGADPQGR